MHANRLVPLHSCSPRSGPTWVTVRTVKYGMGFFVSVYWTSHTLLFNRQGIHIHIHGQDLGYVFLDSWLLIQAAEMKICACLLQYDSKVKYMKK